MLFGTRPIFKSNFISICAPLRGRMEINVTNFDRIKEYYKYFNEDERLTNDNSGRLEFEMTMKKIQKYLPESAEILDLEIGRASCRERVY